MDKRVSRGSFEDGGSRNSIDIEIADMSSDTWSEKGEEVFAGMVEGFELLQDEIEEFAGFRVTLHDLERTYDGDNSWSELENALNQEGFNKSTHYHVIYDGSFYPSKIGSYHTARPDDGTMWHDTDVKGISGLSLATTRLSFANSDIRGLHQALHNYINGEIALDYASSTDEYEAVHELGSTSSSRRTVMADTYVPAVTDGECSGSFWNRWKAPKRGDFEFSRCTLAAIHESIQ